MTARYYRYFTITHFSRPSNFGRVAVSLRNMSIVYHLRRSSQIIAACSTVSFPLSRVSRRTNVRRLRLAPDREESAIGVAGRSQVFKWLPCLFTSARRPKCRWDSGRRVALLLPEAAANVRKIRLRNNETKRKTNARARASSFGITFLLRAGWRKTRESLDDNTLILRVLYCARWSRTRKRIVVDILEKGGEVS